MWRIMRIVLTGGPGAGKTTVARALAARRPDRYVIAPEAASQVYKQLGTRWDLMDADGRRDVQRRIYRLQLRQEESLGRLHPDRVMLLDRGSVDGSAYWPDGPEAYWRDLGTTLEAELARYQLVIWMQSCAAIGLYDGGASNPCRFESAADAIACGEKLLKAWEAHPNLHTVAACPSLEEKIAAVERILENHETGPE